jgi:hypothetical protein
VAVAAAIEASPIRRFYDGTGRDHAGRWLAEIQGWDDAALERVHDYIQWLFPLPEASGFNPHAPLLTKADIAAFRTDPALRAALGVSFDRILAFYGFAFAQGVVIPSENEKLRRRNWCAPGNHNLLRISRILRSLTLLGLESEAAAFLARLEHVQTEGAAMVIGQVTARYWRNAVHPA